MLRFFMLTQINDTNTWLTSSNSESGKVPNSLDIAPIEKLSPVLNSYRTLSSEISWFQVSALSSFSSYCCIFWHLRFVVIHIFRYSTTTQGLRIGHPILLSFLFLVVQPIDSYHLKPKIFLFLPWASSVFPPKVAKAYREN